MKMIKKPVFTDSEHRILLSALSRERKVCEEYQRNYGTPDNVGEDLITIVNSIERKIHEMQY